MSNKLNTAISALVALLLVAVLALQVEAARTPVGAQAASSSSPREITVVGEGTSMAPPDIAYVDIGVQSNAAKLADALKDSNAKMTAINEALQAQGVAATDIQTSTYAVSPQYNNADGETPVLVGYQVINTARVTLHQLDKVGAILDQATQAGANQISALTFSLEEPSQLQAVALEKALADARTRAQALAQSGGLQLGEIEQITTVSASNPIPYAAARVATADAGVPVQPGTVSVDLQVQVTFRIG